MVNLGGATAHFVKLLVTYSCTKNLSVHQFREREWALRAYQIFLLHSVLGILRYGTPVATSTSTTAKHIRKVYDWFSNVIDVLPLALLTTDILHGYHVDEKFRLILLTLGMLPVVFQLAPRPKGSSLRRQRVLTNLAAVLQLTAIILIGLQNGNYAVISLVGSYIIACFFVEIFADRYDVPYNDLTQYCLSFVEIFAFFTLIDN